MTSAPDSTRPRRLPLALLAACALAPAAAALQAVHVVAGGGPGALQNAIAAAADGDTVLVQGGTYDAVAIAGKTLTVVSDPTGSTLVAGVTITGLAAGQRAVVAGLRVVAPAATSFLAPDCVRVEDCAGSVRLEALSASLAAPNGNPALRVVNSPDVAVSASTLTGSAGQVSTQNFEAANPGAAIACTQSRVAAHDCVLRGGNGLSGFTQTPCSNPFTWFSTAGAAGVALDATSTLVASGGEIRGGTGGNGVPARCDCFLSQFVPGTNGMPGGAAVANALGSAAYRVDTVLVGGAGGSGSGNVNCGSGPMGATSPGASGPAATNPVTDLPGPPLRLAAPTHLRTGQPIALTVHGAPGDAVFLGRSFETRWILNAPALGVLLTGPSGRRIPLGVIPGSGTLVIALPPATLPAGVQSQPWFLQVFSRDSAGALRIGAGSVLTVIDAAF